MKNNSPPIRPLFFIGICTLSFLLIICLPEAVFAPLNHATAYLAGLCIGLFGGQAAIAGRIISLDGFRVRIITECTALYSVVFFGSFVFSVPASIKSRAAGILLGGSFLNAANILRIAMVAFIGAAYPALFESVHVYLAQVVMVILVLAASLAWLDWAARSDAGDASFLIRAVLLASVIFPFWLLMNTVYVKSMDRLVSGIFALANYRLFFTYDHLAYFQTFNVVLFIAMMLAERRLSIRHRIAWAAAGTAILAIGHLMFRVGNVLLTAFSWQPALPATIFLNVFGEYLLPVFLWTAAVKTCQVKKEASA